MYHEWILINVLKLKHIKSWSLLFSFHFVTPARRSYNIKITYKYVALFTFHTGLIITRIRHHRLGVGGGVIRGDIIADKS